MTMTRGRQAALEHVRIEGGELVISCPGVTPERSIEFRIRFNVEGVGSAAATVSGLRKIVAALVDGRAWDDPTYDLPVGPANNSAMNAAPEPVASEAGPRRVPVGGAIPITDEQLERWFTHHPPRSEREATAYAALRDYGRQLAAAIVLYCPPGPDATHAVRKVREAVMTANAGIACGGK